MVRRTDGERLTGSSDVRPDLASRAFLLESRIHGVAATTPRPAAIAENRGELTDEDLQGFDRVGGRGDDWLLLPGNSRSGRSRSADNE